jgi:threonine/homoserine/homoserine lactone efflux protein
MPLSEQEQRLLDEMERSLYQNDADFVATVGARRGKPNYTVLVIGILLALLGVGVLITGVAIQQPLVGVLGFILMFAGVLTIVSPPRRALRAENAAKARTSSKQKARGGSFMDNLNDRWDRRTDGH